MKRFFDSIVSWAGNRAKLIRLGDGLISRYIL